MEDELFNKTVSIPAGIASNIPDSSLNDMLLNGLSSVFEKSELSYSSDQTNTNFSGNNEIDIDEDLATSRRNLRESYQVLCAARDALSKISFIGIEKKFHKEKFHLSDIELTNFINSNSNSIDSCLLNLSDELKKKTCELPKHIESILELKVFFQVINLLRRKMFKIRNSEEQFMKLNETVSESIIMDQENVERLKGLLADIAPPETIERVRKMFDPDMS